MGEEAVKNLNGVPATTEFTITCRLARDAWKQESRVEVWSNSRNQWFEGVIKKITNTDNLVVQYRVDDGGVHEKDIGRYDKSVRPKNSSSLKGPPGKSDGCLIVIDHVPGSVDDDHLKTWFRQEFGNILNFYRNTKAGSFTIMLESQEAAEKAVKKMNGQSCEKDFTITCRLEIDTRRIVVDYVPRDVKNDDLEVLFSKSGKILNIDRDLSRDCPVPFTITFESQEAAKDAVKKMNGQKITMQNGSETIACWLE